MVVSKCRNLKFINVTTVKDPNTRNTDQATAFAALTEDLKKRNITLYVEYSDQLHDRQIMYVPLSVFICSPIILKLIFFFV